MRRRGILGTSDHGVSSIACDTSTSARRFTRWGDCGGAFRRGFGTHIDLAPATMPRAVHWVAASGDGAARRVP